MHASETREPLHVLPLYSLLAPEEQRKVFLEPPMGSRLCVLSTNVAETSLTIPNIRYVVDCGLVKERHYDGGSGSYRFDITWTSKASAAQRAGRAGRTGPGHCYRLYSSPVFDQSFSAFSQAEIQRTAIEGLILQLKAMGVDRPENFPFPSAPAVESIRAAEARLVSLGALAPPPKSSGRGGPALALTVLGRRMSALPMSPPWARLAVVADETAREAARGSSLRPLAIALAAVLSIGEPFTGDSHGGEDAPSLPDEGESDPTSRGGRTVSSAIAALGGAAVGGDHLIWLNAFGAFARTPQGGRRAFCREHHLMFKRMEEAHLQFRMISRTLGGDDCLPPMAPVKHSDSVALRKLLASSLPDNVADRVEKGAKIAVSAEGDGESVPRRLPFPLYRIRGTADASSAGRAGPSSRERAQLAYLHPSSVLLRSPPKTIIFTELVVSNGNRYVRCASAAEEGWTK